jgi:hypothetical protein
MAHSQASKTRHYFGSVVANDIDLYSQNVTQITSITTPVTLSAHSGIITTVTANTATNGNSTFTANHPSVTADKVVLATIVGYSGNGAPSIRLSTTTGSFNVIIQNHNDIAALNAPLRISYCIL